MTNYKLIRVFSDNSSPAWIHRPSKTIFLNDAIFKNLPSAYQKLIVLHEIGHGELNTRNEIEADNFAFEQFAGKEPLSLKNSVKVIADLLNHESNPAHRKRLEKALKRAYLFDIQNYNNLKLIQKMNENCEISEFGKGKLKRIFKGSGKKFLIPVVGQLMAANQVRKNIRNEKENRIAEKTAAKVAEIQEIKQKAMQENPELAEQSEPTNEPQNIQLQTISNAKVMAKSVNVGQSNPNNNEGAANSPANAGNANAANTPANNNAENPTPEQPPKKNFLGMTGSAGFAWGLVVSIVLVGAIIGAIVYFSKR